jgi:hypothetical protein
MSNDFGLTPVLFIGNSYRRQLFAPFLASKPFGRHPHLYLTSSRILNCSRLLAFFYKIILSFAKGVVISDEEGAEVLDRYPLPQLKTVFWFSWNAADELKDWQLSKVKLYPNLKICFLFSDETKKAKDIFSVPSCHFKYPVLQKCKPGSQKKYLISYIGELDIVGRLEKEDPEINDYLWELTERFTSKEYFDPKLIDVNRAQSTRTSYPLFVWILKNRMRYRYAKTLKDKYGKDFTLVGNDWKKFGIDSLPSDYDPKSRFDLYSSSKLCLDLLSKSTLEAHYPRSAEIISYSNGIIQLKAIDSAEMFGDQLSIRTFGSITDLNNKIENLLSLSNGEFSSLGEALRGRLSASTRQYNLRSQ